MSKSLRMLLLSMLVVVVAAMPAMAASKISSFYWTGASNDLKWDSFGNWSADHPSENKYPGEDTTASGDVYISGDVKITISSPIVGTLGTIYISKDAHISLDLGTAGFKSMPSFDVQGKSELKLTGTANKTLGTTPKWAVRNGAKLTLALPVTLSVTNFLTLSVDDGGTLTIDDASLLSYTSIDVKGDNATVTLNKSPEAAAAGKRLQITTTDTPVLNIPSEITLYGNSGKSNFTIKGNFIKDGAGELKLSRTNSKDYGAVISSDTTANITVKAGSLTFVTPYVTHAGLDITVSKDTKLNVAEKAIDTDKTVLLRVSGDATIADAGIGGASSIFNASTHALDLSQFNLSIDVAEGGTVTFSGVQPINGVSGKGKVVVSGTDAMLLVSGDAQKINSFSGTLEASSVGLVGNFDDMPFASADSNISTITLYNGATLSLDAAKLANVEGMETLAINLRSNYNVANNSTLGNAVVGNLDISGDVTIGTLTVDGTWNENGIATVNFNASSDVLTVSSLVLHANESADGYTSAYAIAITGEGTFAPQAISNVATGSSVGKANAIDVKEGATLKLVSDVPEGNGLALTGAKLDTTEAASAVTLPSGLTLAGNNTIKLKVTGDNMKMTGGGSDVISVSGDLVLNGTLSFDLDFQDDNQVLGNKYRLLGSESVTVTSTDNTINNIKVIGAFANAMTMRVDSYGLYGRLDKLALQPRALVNGTKLSNGDKWSVSPLGTSDFTAKISYDLPASVEPATLINLISVDVKVAGTTLTSSRTNVGDSALIKTFKVNSADKEIVLTGTLYVDEELETTVTLGWRNKDWTKQSGDWAPYIKAGMYYNGDELASSDFAAADPLTLMLAKPEVTSDDTTDDLLSEDVYADSDDIAIESDTLEITVGSGDVVLTIEGIREAVVVDETSAPVLVGGVYVWMNGFDNSTQKYEMRFNGEWVLMESLDIRIDGKSLNPASVDIEGGTDSIIVTIPAALFDTETTTPKFQEVTIVGTAENGHTLTAGPVNVHIVPDYEERPVDEGMGALVYSKKQLPASPIIVDGITDLTGPFSFDVTIDGSTETPSWFKWNNNAEDGTIAYEVADGAETGTYEMKVVAYTATGGYVYKFTLTINDGFKINEAESRFTDTYSLLNYEAHFTTTAPAGTKIDWELVSNDRTSSWLKAVPSGDVFVVYGQLPEWVNTDVMDEVPDPDPNDYTYTVKATVSGDTASADTTITVEEDAEEVVTPADAPAGLISLPGSKDISSIGSADTTYSVDINFSPDDYGTEIEFSSLPYWLVATPKTAVVDGEEVIVGYTITYKEGVAVKAGESGVVRFEDPAGNIISWPVTFTETVEPTPEPGAEFKITATPATLTLSRDAKATVKMSADVEGVTYTADKTWAVVSGDTVTITAPASSDKVTITGTANGRTASTDITVTVISSGPEGGDQPLPGSEFMYSVSGDTTVSVALAARDTSITIIPRNVSGDVIYTSSANWVSVDQATGVVAITPTDSSLVSSTPHTVTITLTDTGRTTANTASLDLTITVTSGGVTPTPGSGDVTTAFSVTASRSVLTVAPGDTATFTLSHNALGEVSYSVNQTWAEIDDDTDTVTITAPETEGSYSVTITATDSGRSTDSNTDSVTVTVIVDEDLVRSLGSSGGGCDAGFGAMALALALPLFLRRRRS